MYQYGNVAFKHQNERRYKRPSPAKPDKVVAAEHHSNTVVRPSVLSISQGKLLVLFAVILALAVLILLMSRSVLITEMNYKYLSLEKEFQQLQESNALLEAEIAKLSSPDRILSVAEKELGMTMKKDSITILSRSKLVEP